MLHPIALLTFSMLISIAALSQTLGSYTLNVTFPSAEYNVNRDLYFHVPLDYDSTQSYKLVIGFRGGPHTNAGQFRDQLNFLADSIGAIILCPENNHHFWDHEGRTKLLYKYSLDTTMKLYNIDTNYIYLTGLSYGGRHAVIVAMNSDSGAIPNIRGVIPFAPGTDAQLMPTYNDVADFSPACICIGLNDASNFISVANTLHNDITVNLGVSLLNEIAGVGHTVAFPTYPSEMMECIKFIDDANTQTGISIPLNPKNYSFYPNPASDVLKVSALDKKPYFFSIHSVDGKLELNGIMRKGVINLKSLSKGIKYLIIHEKNQELKLKFMKS